MERAAQALVLPAKGIGDALLMMIASHALLKAGYRVTTCHPALTQLKNWFPEQQFASDFSSALLEGKDLILIENDNGRRVKELKELKSSGKLDALVVFYPTYFPEKNGPLQNGDQVFDKARPMAENIAEAIARLLGSTPSLNNGLKIPKGLKHRHYPKRVLLHPTSSTPKKNWRKQRYLALARALKKQGYDPVFVLSSKERHLWREAENNEREFPLFPSLDDLARFTYESGYLIGNDSLLGHLASNLNVPTLIVAREEEQMRLWRPGWLKGSVVTASPFAPKKYWPFFLSKRKVLSSFYELVRTM